jgi:hypothetical protein
MERKERLKISEWGNGLKTNMHSCMHSGELRKLETKKIKLFVMDVDGTLTDGCTYYSERGEELKRFNMKDGFGIMRAHREIKERNKN